MTVICKNCKYYKRDIPFIFSSKFAKCTNPDITDADLVNGKKTYSYCSIERKNYSVNKCGPEGKLFEPK